MSERSVTAADAGARVLAILDEYLADAAQGRAPDKRELLARHPELAGDLEACLASLEFIGQAVDRTAPPSAADAVRSAARVLGDFQIVREVGRGGMGVVYEARQLSLDRRVALKVLPFAGMLDRRQLQRFKNEAQAAAQLDHPHIVDVIAVGCERAVHYYAMRFIEGQTLAQAIDELRRACEPGGPAAQLGLENTSPSALASDDTQSEATRSADLERQAPPGLDRPEMVNAGIAEPGESAWPSNSETRAPIGAAALGGFSCDLVTAQQRREYFHGAALLVADVADALDFAHQVGIVHRDVKPSNILLDGREKAWITDFGLAQMEAGTQMTSTGEVLGTLAYMSPEQAQGRRQLLDHRTDVYSLGATLYELLALQPPFADGDRASLIRKIIEAAPSRPMLQGRPLPAELETIVLKTLEKAPADRYATAGELAADLRRFAAGEPIRARPPSARQRAIRWTQRHVGLVYSIGAALLIALAASLAAGLAVYHSNQVKDQALGDARDQRRLAGEREASLRQRLYAADIRMAHQCWQRGDVAGAQALLAAYAGPAGDELRGFEWHYLTRLLAASNEPLAVLRPRHGQVYSVQFSPEGGWLAAACGDGRVQLWNANDWTPRYTLSAHRSDANCVAFSPDGRTLASAGEDGRLCLWDVETAALRQSFDAGVKDTLALGVSPDGQTLASGGVDGMVRLWRLPAGERAGEFRATSGRVQDLAFSADGARLATAGGDGRGAVWDVAGLRAVAELPRMAHAVFSVSFSPDGSSLAAGDAFGLVTLVDLRRGRLDAILGHHQRAIRTVAFSPSGRLLASAGEHAVVELWDPAGRSLRARLSGHERRVWRLAFSPDGRRLASASEDGSLRIWDASPEPVLKQVDQPEALRRVKFAETGDRLLTANQGGALTTWNARSLERLAVRPGPGQEPEISFSPDRRQLAAYGREQVLLGPAEGELVRFEAGERGTLCGLALLRDQRLLLKYESGEFDVWNIERQTLLDRRQLGEQLGLRSSVADDGRLAAICSADSLALYDADSLAPRWRVAEQNLEYTSLALSADGRWLARSRLRGTIELFDAATGEQASLMAGHQIGAETLAFSPDGRTLASAGRDHTLRLWHVATGQEFFTLSRNEAAGFGGVDFSPDGDALAAVTNSADGRGVLMLWSASARSGAVEKTPSAPLKFEAPK